MRWDDEWGEMEDNKKCKLNLYDSKFLSYYYPFNQSQISVMNLLLG